MKSLLLCQTSFVGDWYSYGEGKYISITIEQDGTGIYKGPAGYSGWTYGDPFYKNIRGSGASFTGDRYISPISSSIVSSQISVSSDDSSFTKTLPG
ncbi:hypothetical protein KTT_49890 [Tengunoibacter tsumagoiensis]|uniref:Uncharacterized protein n=1 Tax=Tengunoibacter tsumagoiensis TaxID=2014871 RepID=A0A402A7J7_9CHLR|nr:hypothetical protein KTT_49890 [Tengunoibacter tsumagoiensis]